MVLSAGSVSAAQGYDGNSFWYFQRQVVYALVGRRRCACWSRGCAAQRGRPWRCRSWAARRPDADRGASGVGDLAVRRVAMDRPRAGHAAALGVRQARPGRRRRDDPHEQVEPARRADAARVPAGPSSSAWSRLLGIAAARPGHDVDPVRLGVRSCCSSPGCGCATWRSRPAAGSVGAMRADRRRDLPAHAVLRRLAQPVGRSAGHGFQLIQGLIAIGSGGWLGTGLGTSRAKWDFLPNAHSDFIFAVIGEELGLARGARRRARASAS